MPQRPVYSVGESLADIYLGRLLLRHFLEAAGARKQVHQRVNLHVCTTQQLTKFYGCGQDSIQKNFERNAERFEEGKHFFKIQGEELRQFKNNQPAESRLVGKNAAHLILWTERGAMRHAKMVETDAAWEVFEEMEDRYFATTKARPQIADGKERSTKMDRLPLYHFAVDTVIAHHLNFSKVPAPAAA